MASTVTAEIPAARQREVRDVDLDPIQGREQAGRRPALVISVDQLGAGSSELAIVVPITTTQRPSPLYVRIDPPKGGVREVCYAMPEMIRSISRKRLVERWGIVRPGTVAGVIQRVRLLTHA